jgi:hypothetical protein
MGRCIVKLNGCYAEWSTVVDAPITSFMPKDEFERWYEREHGRSAMAGLPERMERVEATGTSSLLDTLDDLIAGNRAGKGETTLTKDELWAVYALPSQRRADAQPRKRD